LSDSTVDGALDLPEEMRHLTAIAGNMYWSWNRSLRRLFERIDPVAWHSVGENPIALLKSLDQSKILQLQNDVEFQREVSDAYETHRWYLHEKMETWFQKQYGQIYGNNLIAYFSAEFGIASCLRIYAGGLGILAGDHLKSASDLGVPLVGVGLFYRRGYFSQKVSDDGWQEEHYPENRPENLPLRPVLDANSGRPLLVSIPLGHREVRVRAWQVSVGRILLYLLDSYVPSQNSKDDCEITAELYGGDSDTRLKQEMILGFGGAKLLQVLGIKPSIYHMNEGHSAFVGLERIREILEGDKSGKSFSEAVETVRTSSLFTTHTPVPAGIDIFSPDQIEDHLSWYHERLGIPASELFSLGQESQDSKNFNMAVLAIKLSRDVNAVSKLHREVVKKLWENLLEQESFSFEEDRPAHIKRHRRLASVTNGIHIPSWISDSMADVYDQYLGNDWKDFESSPEMWSKVTEIPSEKLWKVRCQERAKFVEFVRVSCSNHSLLDPDALTIGFARRFATYKRATLALSDRDRLVKLLSDTEKPVQFVFSGKAHPRDNEGKKVMQEVIRFSKSESARFKVAFLPDYDISKTKRLVHGVDLWLNNPRRPLEACGTSGMKVLANGGLNASALDGWWDEAYSPSRGWSIGTNTMMSDAALQDKQDSESLYDVLEHHIIPEFYDRTSGIPMKWVERMKHSISKLCPQFNTNRMLIDYSQHYYFRDTN